MIAKLTGRVDSLEEGRCIIDVQGVGYQVHASTRTLASLPQPPATAQLLIETHVREDAILLFGFAGRAERDWFRLLTTIQGVGAKLALGILSALSPADLVAVITAQDRASLTRAPGVGPRLAVRLLSELRDKASTVGAEPGSLPAPAPQSAPGIAEDALAALTGLGYKRPEAQPAITRAIA
ncbi:MAG: Holliday junction branch migration protein RuvA, partial [Acetobacteraceae bacterium]|nr:Holliday junction branch migration protein RuvA [Acetobacteraceae bacterium]